MSKQRKKCLYCQQREPLINTLHYEYPHELGEHLGQVVHIVAHIEGHWLVVEEGTTDVRQINYCPICGRPLNEEEE